MDVQSVGRHTRHVDQFSESTFNISPRRRNRALQINTIYVPTRDNWGFEPDIKRTSKQRG